MQFLSNDDEKKIKKQYSFYKKHNLIDPKIIHLLDDLNSIKGLATIYSCQGHLNNPSYITFSVSMEMIFFATEAIHDLILINPDLEVIWYGLYPYNIGDKQQYYNAITLISNNGIDYLYDLLYKLKD